MIKKLFLTFVFVALLCGTAGAFAGTDFHPFYGNKSPECFMSIDYTVSSPAPAVWVITKQGAEVGRAYIRTDGKLWREHSNCDTEVIPCCSQGMVSPIWYCPASEEVKPAEVEVKEVVVELPHGPMSFVIYFDFDEDVIREDQEIILQSLIDYVTKYGYESVTMTASCDYRGSDAYNIDLGHRRAAATSHWLIENGLDAGTFTIVNNGDRFSPTRLMKGIFCADCWEDRKVEITIE